MCHTPTQRPTSPQPPRALHGRKRPFTPERWNELRSTLDAVHVGCSFAPWGCSGSYRVVEEGNSCAQHTGFGHARPHVGCRANVCLPYESGMYWALIFTPESPHTVEGSVTALLSVICLSLMRLLWHVGRQPCEWPHVHQQADLKPCRTMRGPPTQALELFRHANPRRPLRCRHRCEPPKRKLRALSAADVLSWASA